MTSNARISKDVCVVGCGRWLRRDDQAGLLTVRALQHTWLKTARLVLTESPASDLLDYLDDTKLLLFVDAAKADRLHPPGFWRRLDYGGPGGPLKRAGAANSHTMGADFALELAWELKRLPSNVWIYLIVAGDCTYGELLTPPVAEAVRSVARSISADIRQWLTEREVTHA